MYRIEIAAASNPTSWATLAKRESDPTTGLVIKLDDVVSNKGLADESYFDIRIAAEDKTQTHPKPKRPSDASDTIRIVDNPLLLAGGQAYAISDDEASLKWTTDSNARNYKILYRELGFYTRTGIGERDHTSLNWPKGSNWPYHHGAETETSDTPGNETIDDLDDGDIYAFQINYEISDTKVFSARDAYVWPSDAKPGDDARVATYPFFGHHSGRTFKYIMCRNSFPSGQQTQWENVVKSAFGQWQNATDGFIIMKPKVENCLTGQNSTPTAKYIQNDDRRNEVRMLDLAAVGIHNTWEFKSDVFKICLSEASACVTSFTGYSNLRTQVPAERARLGELVKKAEERNISVKEIAELLGYIDKAAGNTRQAENTLQGVDVTFNESAFPAGSTMTPTDVKFNTCVSSSGPDTDDNDNTRPFYAYATAVHEAGHALGLSNFSYYDLLSEGAWSFLRSLLSDWLSWILPDVGESQEYETAHPTIPDSVMNYDDHWDKVDMRWISHIRHPESGAGFSESDCSPHPFDVMAIYALYQTVP